MSAPTSNAQVIIVGPTWSEIYTLASDDSILFDPATNMVTLFVRDEQRDMKDPPRGSAGGVAKFGQNDGFIVYGGGGGGGRQE